MNYLITKSDFLKYLQCSSFLWYYKNGPDALSNEMEEPFNKRLRMQGYEVEHFTRLLFPDADLVKGLPQEALSQTQFLLKKGVQQLFQASFMKDGLFISCDILVWNSLFHGWDLYEVKGSSSKEIKKETHLIDVTFQKIVLEGSGLNLSNIYLIELNKDYIREGDIQVDELFQISEITTDVLALEDRVRQDIQDARELLNQSEPDSCGCRYKGRSQHCPVFPYLYPNVPEYSVYDLVSIGNSKAKLKALVDEGIIDIKDIREDHDLTDRHRNQWRVHIKQKPIIRFDKIKKELDKLVYPIYFLDYETLSSAVPKYDFTYPYQQVVFQYSVHVVYENGELEHNEFLHKLIETPMQVVANRLSEDIGDNGSVIVWNKTFESTCNKDLASVNPELEEFLFGLNDRMFDLMDIFRKQYYLHDDFKGSYSIKKVLPVMCPELDYGELSISEGGTASIKYEEAMFGNLTEVERQKTFDDLLKYCHLDTWAMVRIWQELTKVCA